MDFSKIMISLSIVLFNTSEEDINNILISINNIKSKYVLYIIDNSPTDFLKSYFVNDDFIIYIHNPSNPGFGASHNIALNRAIETEVQYHFVINPDVYFDTDVVTKMVNFMNLDENINIGMLMPQILNLDGSPQNLPKLLPSPLSIVLRKIKKPDFIYKKFINKYELRFVDQDRIYNAPILSGCFTLFRVNSLKEIGLYDDRFFMYFEDWDVSRRMQEKYLTVYYPEVYIYHGYESGANKSKRLFKIFIDSAIKYFNKWGWIFDKKRYSVNKKTLNQFKCK